MSKLEFKPEFLFWMTVLCVLGSLMALADITGLVSSSSPPSPAFALRYFAIGVSVVGLPLLIMQATRWRTFCFAKDGLIYFRPYFRQHRIEIADIVSSVKSEHFFFTQYLIESGNRRYKIYSNATKGGSEACEQFLAEIGVKIS